MSEIIYDVIIIGSGPAGMSAGIYATRGGLKSLLIECFMPSSQVLMTDLIENYPGFEKITGFELIEKLKNQAKGFGLEFVQGRVEQVFQTDIEKNVWQIKTKDKVYQGLSVILATGARFKQLNVQGEKELLGKGVSYCAVCDGAFFKQKEVVVVGGGDSAVSEALYLANLVKKVTLVHRRNRLRAVSVLANRAKQNHKIEFAWDSLVTQVYGKDRVQAVGLKNLVKNTQSRLECSGVFVSIGYTPNTGFLVDLVKLDDSGYIIADQSMQTSKQGIFACGDCLRKPLRQVVTACGEGAVAGFSAIEYVSKIKGQAYD